jgi:hypothetical protein
MVNIKLVFNSVLIDDADTEYAVYFKDANGNQFGTSSALIVEDDSSNPQNGQLSGNKEISFDFDYDNNNQGGRTPATNADIVIVATGLNSARYTISEETITNVSSLIFVVCAKEEN